MDPKPPPRALPPLGTISNGESSVRALPPLNTSTGGKDQRALPSVKSKTSFFSNSELLDEPQNDQADSLRNRSIARMKRRAKNASRAGTPDQSTLEDQPAESEVTEEKSKSEVKRPRQTRAMRREALRGKVVDMDVPENGNVLVNMINDEDVVPVDHLESQVMTALPGVAGNGASSQPQDKVYIQTTSGFKSHPNEWLINRQMLAAKKSENLDEALTVTKTSNIALSFHKVFMFIGFLLHGFLAGIAIWQIVFPFSLNAEGTANFLQQYFRVAQPIQTAFYIVLVYCVISAMDRFNLGGPNKSIFWRLLKFDPAAWLIAIYFLAFAFNVGLSGIDFWLGRIAPTLQTGVSVTDAYLNADQDGAVRTWLVLNVLRCTCCIFGWLIVSVRPKQDDTTESMTKAFT